MDCSATRIRSRICCLCGLLVVFWSASCNVEICLAREEVPLANIALVVGARLSSFNKEQEEAARDLGANDWQAFRDVLVPHMRPALIAGALLAFTLSLDDFVITFFTSGPDTITFPVKVYSMLRFSVNPEVNAASTMLILLTILLMVVMMVMQSRAQKKG